MLHREISEQNEYLTEVERIFRIYVYDPELPETYIFTDKVGIFSLPLKILSVQDYIFIYVGFRSFKVSVFVRDPW